MCFIWDARVLDEDWQVFTRYGGQQGETWYETCEHVALSRHSSNAITLDNSLPPFTPFDSYDYHWLSRSANDGCTDYK